MRGTPRLQMGGLTARASLELPNGLFNTYVVTPSCRTRHTQAGKRIVRDHMQGRGRAEVSIQQRAYTAPMLGTHASSSQGVFGRMSGLKRGPGGTPGPVDLTFHSPGDLST